MSDVLISKLTAKSQTVIPQAIRKRLGIKPGDHIRYRVRGKKIEIEKLDMGETEDDPFIAFNEWSSKADDAAYKDL